MGEIADMIIDGILCENCGGYIGDSVDYTRKCPECTREFRREFRREKNDMVKCPHCQKKVKTIGLKQHIDAKHKSHLEICLGNKIDNEVTET